MSKTEHNMKCPHCDKGFTLQRIPKLEDTKLTVTIEMKKGHMLQAETLGGTLKSLAALLKAQAKELGGKVTVLISDLRVATPDKIEVELAVLTNTTGRELDHTGA